MLINIVSFTGFLQMVIGYDVMVPKSWRSVSTCFVHHVKNRLHAKNCWL